MKCFVMKRFSKLSVVVLAILTAFLLMPTLPAVEKANASGGSSMTTAEQLTMDKMVRGSCEYENFDYYKFNTSSQDATYVIKVASEETDGSLSKQLRMYVYNEDYEHVNGYGDIIYTQGVLSLSVGQTRDDDIRLKKNSTYYIRLGYDYRYGKSDGNNFNYSVGVTEKITSPAKTVISSAKAGKKKLTVKWKAAARATNYQIAYKKKGASKWIIKTTEIKSYVIKKLKSKKKYVVKVRGYKTVNGRKYCGSWSKTKTVKAK